MKEEYKNLNELVKVLKPYLNQSAFARITGINPGQMRQYISGVRNPSKETLDKINDGLYRFGERLKNMGIVE